MGCDPAHRCLLIRGEGRGFCAGVDIKEMQKHPERIVDLNRGNYLSFRAVRAAEVPVIAAVHGFVNMVGLSTVNVYSMVSSATRRKRSTSRRFSSDSVE